MDAPRRIPPVDELRNNRLLAALFTCEPDRWRPLVEPVDLKLRQVLYESGQRMTHVYFPTSAIVSLLYVTEDGSSAEIATIGREGLIGVSMLMGGGFTTGRAVVQGAGRGYRVRADALCEEFDRSRAVRRPLLRYMQAFVAQVAQTAVCNRHHTVQQQLCRWLLLCVDALDTDELAITQEQIANMLGVRRGGVTEAALKLQHSGSIRYSRGRIRILEREGLERLTCECYGVVKKERDRLLPVPWRETPREGT